MGENFEPDKGASDCRLQPSNGLVGAGDGGCQVIEGGWTTKDELAFLKETLAASNTPEWNILFLRGYLAGCRRRSKWGEVDEELVVDYVCKRLLKYKTKEQKHEVAI